MKKLLCTIIAIVLISCCVCCAPDGNGEGVRFFACDQFGARIVLYDTENYVDDLEKCVEWEYELNARNVTNVSGVKYRENTVFGDVVLVCCSVGYAGMIKYPSKEVVWENTNCGNNPHSIEILPSGNLLVASTTGSTVRLYHTSALLGENTSEADIYDEYDLLAAHGVLYSPAENLLWAIGYDGVVAFSVNGEGTEERLTKVDGKGFYSKAVDGHDLSVSVVNANELLLSKDEGVAVLDKTTGEVSEIEGLTGEEYARTKGFGMDKNGNYVLCTPNGGKNAAWKDMSISAWCSDEITVAFKNENDGFQIVKYHSSASAFYKIFCFNGDYQ